MSMYKLEPVTLGEIEGRGYAFSRRTVFGKTFHGVFFPDEEEELDRLRDEDALTFAGPVYHRRRDRTARKKNEELLVSIVGSTSTPMGERAEFEAKEE